MKSTEERERYRKKNKKERKKKHSVYIKEPCSKHIHMREGRRRSREKEELAGDASNQN